MKWHSTIHASKRTRALNNNRFCKTTGIITQSYTVGFAPVCQVYDTDTCRIIGRDEARQNIRGPIGFLLFSPSPLLEVGHRSYGVWGAL